ncbi:MAG TPA: hypothetical protein VLG12_03385 [Candidatus Saccharimonadales bacterium]|nr:hypothetical protein [Candidatus Saccharimonadales bacterium]
MSFFERFQEWRNPTVSKLDMDGVIKKSMEIWQKQKGAASIKKDDFLQSWQALGNEVTITSKLDASIATRIDRLGEIIQYCANFPKALEISRIAERGFNGAEPDAQNLLAYLTFEIFPRMDPD